MRKWLGALLLLSSILTIQACAPKSQDDCGFVQNVYGERISWKTDAAVTMHLHSSVPEAYVAAIVSAAESWDKTAGRKIFNIVTSPRIDGPVTPHKDGKNVFYMMDTWEANKASEQARTSVYWIGDIIQEADVRLNAKNFKFYWNQDSSAEGVNIEALVLHELGHVLGLKHKDTGSSVMATYLANGVDRVRVASTDAAALQCEY